MFDIVCFRVRELIVLGGSGALSYTLFEKSMLESVQKFPFKRITDHLKIKVSNLENTAVIGAAALVLQHIDQLVGAK